MTNFDIYIYINNTNNYTKWSYYDYVLTSILVTLDTSQDDILLLKANE